MFIMFLVVYVQYSVLNKIKKKIKRMLKNYLTCFEVN